METRIVDPQSDQEWQDSVDTAYVLLELQQCIQVGIVVDGPVRINVRRCEELLQMGEKRNIRPRLNCMETVLPLLIKEAQ